MEWNKQTIKGLLAVVCGGVAFYWVLQNLWALGGAVGWLLGILGALPAGGRHRVYPECAHAGD